MTDSNVIVVGGGPSGLVVASELALAGVDVTVYERRTGEVQSRAGTILPRVLELLDTRGLADEFIDRARGILPNPLFGSHMWAGMKPVHWKHLDSRFGYRLVLPQTITEELLAKHALEVGVKIVHGASVTDVQQDADSVRVSMLDEQGREREATGRYLVGCDGGGSVVRQQTKIAFSGHRPTFTGIVADIVMDNPWPEGRRIYGNDRGWLASFPVGDGVTRFNLVHADRQRAAQSEPVEVDEVRLCLREILETDLEFTELRWASRFSDNTALAERFSDRRVFLVGEACRVHYPASGVGMNFCIQDAFNLGWKLAAVVNGHATPELLDTYELERRPVMEALLASIATQCAIQFDFTPGGMAVKHWFETTMMPIPEVNRRLAEELNGLTEPYPVAPDDGRLAGHRVPDLELRLPDRVTTIGRLLRGQRLLVVDLTGSDRFGDLRYDSAPIDVVSGVPLRVPAALGAVDTLIVRPDAYVAWSGTGQVGIGRIRQEIARWYANAH
jgi:2-polyprenyl-6-methoxyphenol hydroxylase-like FAD-dependent oxidoreductase